MPRSYPNERTAQHDVVRIRDARAEVKKRNEEEAKRVESRRVHLSSLRQVRS